MLNGRILVYNKRTFAPVILICYSFPVKNFHSYFLSLHHPYEFVSEQRGWKSKSSRLTHFRHISRFELQACHHDITQSLQTSCNVATGTRWLDAVAMCRVAVSVGRAIRKFGICLQHRSSNRTPKISGANLSAY